MLTHQKTTHCLKSTVQHWITDTNENLFSTLSEVNLSINSLTKFNTDQFLQNFTLVNTKAHINPYHLSFPLSLDMTYYPPSPIKFWKGLLIVCCLHWKPFHPWMGQDIQCTLTWHTNRALAMILKLPLIYERVLLQNDPSFMKECSSKMIFNDAKWAKCPKWSFFAHHKWKLPVEMMAMTGFT